MKEIYFYYGMEMPNLEKTQNLENYRIVLQDYHPLVYKNKARDYFSKSEIYLYFNCHKLGQAEFDSNLLDSKVSSFDHEWNSYVLDLSDSRNINYLIRKSSEMAEKYQFDGFFLDDLDFTFTIKQKEQLIKLVEKIASGTGKKIILNRGFELWDTILANNSKVITAIVLESFIPSHYIEFSDLNWFEVKIEQNLKKIRKNFPEIDLYSLNYGRNSLLSNSSDEFKSKLNEIEESLKSVDIKEINKERNLNKWSSLHV